MRKKVFEEKRCVICDKPFNVNINNKREREKKTCSSKCASKLGSITSLTKTNCKICGKEIMTPKSSANSEFGIYCSNECRKYRYKLKCVVCNNDFYSDKNVTKYCSKECFEIGKKNKLVKIKCDECGEEFERPSYTVPSNKQIFCSRKCCMRNFAKNNPNRYGSKWSRIREKRVKMDNYTCQICGKQTFEKYALNVHHIIPIEQFDNIDEANKLDNLITLCFECHMSLHGRELHIN